MKTFRVYQLEIVQRRRSTIVKAETRDEAANAAFSVPEKEWYFGAPWKHNETESIIEVEDE